MDKSKYLRIVIKIGSSCLTHQNGKLNYTAIEQYIKQIVDLKNKGKEIILVSSGAVGAGMGELKFNLPVTMAKKQGLAAIGQGLLISFYNKILRQFGELGGQILLTASDIQEYNRSNNIYNTLEVLIKNGIIPIINENDSVATDEIKFGDNDTLSARVTNLINADLLIILTDVEGLYNKIPCKENDDLKLISKVDNITDEIKGCAGGQGSIVGTGGMQTKVEAAKIVNDNNIPMVIGPAYKENVISQIVDMLELNKEYNIGTTFLPNINKCKKEEIK